MGLNETDFLILCGGLGSRLQPVIKDVPKILAPVNGKPFLNYLLKYLEQFGMQEIILCTGYKHDQIYDWVTNHYSGTIKIKFSKEDEPLGTGGAVKNAERLITKKNLIVINGDTFLNIDYNNFIVQYESLNTFGLIALMEMNNSINYGTVVVDANSRITSFKEKSQNSSALINCGVYVFSKSLLNFIPARTKISLEYEILPALLKEIELSFLGYEVPKGTKFIDIGTPQRLMEAEEVIADQPRKHIS